jgi:hypothetical protein
MLIFFPFRYSSTGHKPQLGFNGPQNPRSNPAQITRPSLFVQNDTSTSTLFLPGSVLVACLPNCTRLKFSPNSRHLHRRRRAREPYPSSPVLPPARRAVAVRGAKALAASRSRSREEAGPALQMEPAAARKEWRVVPDAPLRSNGAEVPSCPPFLRSCKNPSVSTPVLTRSVWLVGVQDASEHGKMGKSEDGAIYQVRALACGTLKTQGFQLCVVRS